jgi:hypothetical protein
MYLHMEDEDENEDEDIKEIILIPVLTSLT